MARTFGEFRADEATIKNIDTDYIYIEFKVKRVLPHTLLQMCKAVNAEKKPVDVIVSSGEQTRTARQNKLFWKLMRILLKHINGGKNSATDMFPSSNGSMDIDELYCQILERYGEKYDVLEVIDEETAIEYIKGVYRAINVIGSQYYDGKKYLTLKCFYGGSMYNTVEFFNLTDSLIEVMKMLRLDDTEFETIIRELEEIRREINVQKKS